MTEGVNSQRIDSFRHLLSIGKKKVRVIFFLQVKNDEEKSKKRRNFRNF